MATLSTPASRPQTICLSEASSPIGASREPSPTDDSNPSEPPTGTPLTRALLSLSNHSITPIVPHSAPPGTSTTPDSSLDHKTLKEKHRLVRLLIYKWGRNFPAFLEHLHHPKAVRLTDGSMRRARIGDADQAMWTLPPTLWSVDLLMQLREMAETEAVDRVTASRNIAVQIERRLKRRQGVKTVGMVAVDVRKAMAAIRRVRRQGMGNERGSHGVGEEGKVGDGEAGERMQASPTQSLPEKQSSVDSLVPPDDSSPVTGDGAEAEVDGSSSANSSSSTTQLGSAAAVSSAASEPFLFQTVRKLRRELEDIGFDRRELYLDRQEARIRAALQDVQKNEGLDEDLFRDGDSRMDGARSWVSPREHSS
ncbi:MAG: hypothetical protein Q9157_003288 [Trypethelium eluteriae]